MSGSQLEAKNLLSGLLDFSFTSFVTLKFLRVIYALLLALILLGGIGFFFSLAAQGAGSAIVALIVVPLVVFLYVVIARIYMELVALFFRIAENTSILVAQGAAQGLTGPAGVPPGQAPYGSSPGPDPYGPPTGYGPPPQA